MCGIVGLAFCEPAVDDAWLEHGTEALRHRGPDGVGIWRSADGRVGLGHRRLAVIDLTPSAHQPMRDVERGLALVFNGEIYNFRELKAQLAAAGHSFRSSSDTEVILAAYRQWGVGCVDHLVGMFAIALYDERERTLFLARDRAGEKPLYYYADSCGLRFGSELKAILHDATVPRVVDPVSLDCYLALGYVPGSASILSGVNKLPPAHALVFSIDSGQTRLWRYWGLPPVDPHADATSDDVLIEELESLLENSVRRQLVADVPVGLLLSGGVDSSLVTAMAVRASAGVKTFTVRFPGHRRYDETARARLIASHFETEHVELEAEQTSADLLPFLARQFDEPMVDSSMIPMLLVSRVVRQHCTVALGGDGGDELFGGYSQYRRLLWLEHYGRAVPAGTRRALAFAGTALLPVGFRGRNWLHAAGTSFDTELPPVDGLFDTATRSRLMARYDLPLEAEAVRTSRTPQTGDLLQRITRRDFENYLAEDILVKVDRASMLTSLEVRAPFLDHRLVEFAFARVPSRLKATPRGSKLLLKKLGARILPRGFDYERKWGFSIPLEQWLRNGAWADLCRDTLLASGQSVFAASTVNELLEGQRRGHSNGERLFALTLFELWRREYGVTL